jgi:dCTP deaminase
MSVLSYQTLKWLCEEASYEDGLQIGLIWPCVERSVVRGKSYGLSHCGYDIRVRLPDEKSITLGGHKAVTLQPGDFLLASSVERIKMPDDLVAIVHDKSSWARMGIALQNTVLEPGWEGFITLEITAHRGNVTIYDGDPIAQLLFHALDQPTQKPYEGKYQNQADRAVEAINEISAD